MNREEAVKRIRKQVGNIEIEDIVKTTYGYVAIYYGGQPLLVTDEKIIGLNPHYEPHKKILQEVEANMDKVGDSS